LHHQPQTIPNKGTEMFWQLCCLRLLQYTWFTSCGFCCEVAV